MLPTIACCHLLLFWIKASNTLLCAVVKFILLAILNRESVEGGHFYLAVFYVALFLVGTVLNESMKVSDLIKIVFLNLLRCVMQLELMSLIGLNGSYITIVIIVQTGALIRVKRREVRRNCHNH